MPRSDVRIPDLVSVTQAAKILQVSRQAVLKMAGAGRLAGRKVGAVWVFRRSAVEQLRRNPAPAPRDG